MSWLEGLALGLVQGLTEFLPVSSSGHLVIGQALLGNQPAELSFDIALHLSTLLAVTFFLRRKLWLMLQGLFRGDEAGRQGRRLILLVFLASLPTAAIGLLLKDVFTAMFSSVRLVGGALLLTGALLWLTKLLPAGYPSRPLPSWGQALLIGLAQGLAITPGLSRSGATMAAGLFLGLEQKAVFEFSFLISLPAILGASLLELGHLELSAFPAWPPLLLGCLSAGLSGFWALKFLARLVQGGSLHYFAYYCWAVGLMTLLWLA